jgi:hypothetical protein
LSPKKKKKGHNTVGGPSPLFGETSCQSSSQEESVQYSSASDMSYTTAESYGESEQSMSVENDESTSEIIKEIPRATTYDEIIKDLQRFEREIPRAEFAVIEVGDEENVQQANTYLLNKKSFAKQMMTTGQARGDRSQDYEKQPFGLETIAELSQENPSASMEYKEEYNDAATARTY